MPRGIWLVSGTLGCPEPAENRTVTGTGAFFFCRCAALLTEAAEAAGVNVPSNTTPFG
jgi:hypothetical protein